MTCGNWDTFLLVQYAVYAVLLGLLFFATFVAIKRLALRFGGVGVTSRPWVPNLISASIATVVTLIMALYLFFFQVAFPACF